MKSNLHLIEVPFALGSHRRGSDLGPKAIRHAGLSEKLERKGYVLTDEIVPIENVVELNESPYMKNMMNVCAMAVELAQCVDKAIEKEQFPLVLGGDHSIALGTLAGVAEHYDRLGVLWIDAHGDVNTHKTTPSGNIHGMPLAASLGHGHGSLTRIYGKTPKIKPENVVILGVRELDEGEVEFLKEQNITHYSVNDIRWNGLENVLSEIEQKFRENGVDGIHISFDMDSLDPDVVQGVGTPVENGLTYEEAENILEAMKNTRKVVSAEFVETNPLYDVKNQTAKVAVDLINKLL